MPDDTHDATHDTHDATFPFPPGPYGSPPAAYAARRAAACPLAPVTLPSGDEALLATAYDDVRQVLTDPRFSRNLRHPGAPRMLADADFSDDPNALVNMDPPDHTRLRRIVQATFTPRRAESWRPRIQAVTDELLDDLRGREGPVDLMTAFAFPLPIAIICALLGVPAQHSPRFRAWSDAFLSTSTSSAPQRAAAATEFSAYVDELIAARREAPGDDLLDALIDAHDEGDRLSEVELARMVRGLIIAGHETTGNVIGRAVVTLLRHPDQLAALRADPESLLPAAVEEILRTEVPGHGGLLRLAREPVSLPSGAVVEPGQAVLAPVVAANYDPGHFPEPERLDFRRPANKHIAFGHGPHHCLGANLARVELQVAIGSLVTEFPTLALACADQDLSWTTGSRVCGLRSLPVTW
ncbi:MULTISPECIES: cytochrome P450 [unclassified Streptomyces]|uniref:cytochrome P450 n=1 Tax=unclassified Streptomyces TaxID=2593676 RepID=UPI00278BC755|nr:MULTISPECIES: cytochrome P450 [unclassified Streptomyces]